MVKPIADETLSSWLSRNSTNPYVGHVHSVFLDSCRAMAKAGTGGDPDRLYELEGFLSWFPEHNREMLINTFRLSVGTIGSAASLNYCPQCLADDATRMKAPAWRKAWRLRGNCLCEVHDQLGLLQRMPASGNEQFHKAWLAFSQHASNGTYAFGNHFIQRLISLSDSGVDEQRLCGLVLRVIRWVKSAPDRPTYGRPSNQCLQFLLGVFLYRPFCHCKGGVGQWFLAAQKSFAETASLAFRLPSMKELLIGVELASPRNMAFSYLLIGCAYNLFSHSDVEFIRRAFHFTNMPFPGNPEELRAYARCFQPQHLFEFKKSAGRNLFAGDVKHLDWLLE
jgi:hypothetical protein